MACRFNKILFLLFHCSGGLWHFSVITKSSGCFVCVQEVLTWAQDFLAPGYLKWKWLFLIVPLYLGFVFKTHALLTFSLAQVFLEKIWKYLKKYINKIENGLQGPQTLLLPWIWCTLFQSTNRDIGRHSSDSPDRNFRSYLGGREVNPEAAFASSQQAFTHPAQTAEPASGYRNKNASAFGTLFYFAP